MILCLLRSHIVRRALAGLTLALIVGAGAAGCVAQGQRDEMQTLYRRSQEQIEELRAEIEARDATIAALRSSAPSRDAALLDQLERLRADRARMAAELAELEQQLREAARFGPMLPEPLDAALVELAESNPELLSYDADRGMIKLTSDLTFDLGSAEVRETAEPTLRRLADILGRGIARDFEIRIVGHTDNVRISRPETLRRHPTNWHLSVHRAISVKDALEDAGVGPARMSVAGYGQYRPVAPNTARGSAANRRVELYLAPIEAPTAPVDPEPKARPAPRREPDFQPAPPPAEAEPAPRPAEQPAEALPEDDAPEMFK